MFRSRWLNDLFLYVNGFLTWFNPEYSRSATPSITNTPPITNSTAK